MGGDKMLYSWGVFKNTLVGGFIHNAVKTEFHMTLYKLNKI